MANWQYRMEIKRYQDRYKDSGDLRFLKAGLAQECRDLASRVEMYVDKGKLRDIANRFEAVEDIDQYDDVLEELYNWADYEKKCWVATF